MRLIILYLFFFSFASQKAQALTPNVYENLHIIGSYHRECQYLSTKGTQLYCTDRGSGNFEAVSKIVIATYAAAQIEKIDHLVSSVFPGYLRLCENFKGKHKNFDNFCTYLQQHPPASDLHKQKAIHNLHFIRAYAQKAGLFTAIAVNSDGLLTRSKVPPASDGKIDVTGTVLALRSAYEIEKLKEFGLQGLARTSLLGLKKIAKYYEHIAPQISEQAIEILSDMTQNGANPYPWKAMLEASNQVYYYGVEPSIEVPGFTTDEGFISDGFAAISFIDHINHEVIIAYRGTNFDSKFPWYSNPNLHVNAAIGVENRHRTLMTLPILSLVGGSLLGLPAGLLGLLTGAGLDYLRDRNASTTIPKTSWAASLGFGLGCAGFFLGAVVPATIIYIIYAKWGQKRFSNYLSHSGNFASKIWMKLKNNSQLYYRVHVVGHSLGGYLAQHAALMHNFDGIAFNAPSIESHQLKYLRRHYHGEFYNFHLDRDYFSLLFSKGAIGALLVHSHRPNDFSGNIVDFHRMSSIVDYFSKNPELDIFQVN